MNPCFLLLTFIMFLIHPSLQMFFIVEKSETKCISQNKKEREPIYIEYTLRGESEKKASVYIKDPNEKKIFDKKGRPHSSYRTTTKMEGKYSLCVYNPGRQVLMVSFDFKDENKGNEMINVKSIDSLNRAVTGISDSVDRVSVNVKNGAMNRVSFMEKINIINSQITWYSSIKIVFLVIFALFQLYMITSVFKSVKIVSKIQMPSKTPGKGRTSEETEFL